MDFYDIVAGAQVHEVHLSVPRPKHLRSVFQQSELSSKNKLVEKKMYHPVHSNIHGVFTIVKGPTQLLTQQCIQL